MMVMWCIGLSATSGKVTDGELHTVNPRPGDGLSTFLERYDMTSANGMKDAFFQLNNLSSKSTLLLSKKYTLPIHLYNYNGKSIRTTIGINDWETAVRIKEYNESLYKRGARLTHFTKSKILWVPSPELDTDQKAIAQPSKSNHTTPNPKSVPLKSTVTDDIYIPLKEKSSTSSVATVVLIQEQNV